MWSLDIWSRNWCSFNLELWHRATNCIRCSKLRVQIFLRRHKLFGVKEPYFKKLFNRLCYDYSWCHIHTCRFKPMPWCKFSCHKWYNTRIAEVYTLHRNRRKSLYFYPWRVFSDEQFWSCFMRRFHLCRNLRRILVNRCKFATNCLWLSNTRVFCLFRRYQSCWAQDNHGDRILCRL